MIMILDQQIVNDHAETVRYLIDREWLAQDKYDIVYTNAGLGISLGIALSTRQMKNGWGLPRDDNLDTQFAKDLGLINTRVHNGELCATMTQKGVEFVLSMIGSAIRDNMFDELIEYYNEDAFKKVKYDRIK